MSLFAAKTLDRQALLAEAETARTKGKVGKAVKVYRQLLEDTPRDPALHARLAPLLALRGEPDEAWHSFAIAADDLAKKGFADKAIGLLKHAATIVPQEQGLWEALGRLHLTRARRGEAVNALLEGRKQFRAKRQRAAAIDLLRAVHAIEPWRPEATLDLARLLAAFGGREEAIALLDGLAIRTTGRWLRRARGALFGLAPTPRNFWRWLRAALG